VILSKAIREAKGWGSGTKLMVEETSEGVLLRPASPFPPTRLEDVFGCLDARGKHVKIEDFDIAIANEVRRRHARDTNVVVRYLVRDDEAHSARARKSLRAESFSFRSRSFWSANACSATCTALRPVKSCGR